MAKTAKKLVLCLNNQDKTYRPAGHNLAAEMASAEMQSLQSQGFSAMAVDQTSRHRALSFHTCAACKKAAEEATSRNSQASSHDAETQQTTASNESE